MFNWSKLQDPNKPITESSPAPLPPDQRDQMVQWFSFLHLREEFHPTVQQFANVASWMLHNLPAGPEATIAMRKLLEAKDAAVRAAVGKFKVAEEKMPVHNLGMDPKK